MSHRKNLTSPSTVLKVLLNPKTGQISYDYDAVNQDDSVQITIYSIFLYLVFLPEERFPKKLTWQQKLASSMRLRNDYVRCLLSEFLGTFILVSFGVGCTAQFALNASNVRHDVIAVMLGWALAVALGVFVAGGASGGHINPAITVSMATLGRLPWKKVPSYLIGQYLGAFFGAFAVYLVYQSNAGLCGVLYVHFLPLQNRNHFNNKYKANSN